MLFYRISKTSLIKVVRLETDKKSFKKMFPNLSEELESGDCKIQINEVRTDSEKSEKTMADRFRNHDPNAIDFIRRCDTEEQAKTIIAYLEKRGEVSKEDAKKLRQQLRKDGVRSFGPKKEDGYYFKQGGLC